MPGAGLGEWERLAEAVNCPYQAMVSGRGSYETPLLPGLVLPPPSQPGGLVCPGDQPWLQSRR